MIHILIADNDLDSHELIDDLVDLNFRDAKIDRALSKDSLFLRLGTPGNNYDLIIFNYTMEKEEASELLSHIQRIAPEMIKKIVFITSNKQHKELFDGFPVLLRPFSLDEFNTAVKSICSVR